MAVSATDSVQADAALQYAMPCMPRSFVSTQSKPAPAEAKTLQLLGNSRLAVLAESSMLGVRVMMVH